MTSIPLTRNTPLQGTGLFILFRRLIINGFVWFSGIVLLAACDGSGGNGPKAGTRMYLQATDYAKILGWTVDNHIEPLNAFLKSCSELMARGDTEAIGKEQFLSPVVVWKDTCRKATLLPASDEMSARKFFEEEFVPMRVSSDAGVHSLVTGYFVPMLNGSRVLQQPYVYPVYKPPVSPTTFSREQIDLGYLKEQAQVIAYVDDPVQLFFMHIQGSGSIKTTNGEIIHVGYAGNNGQPYVALGKVLADRGALDRKTITMQSIRQWLYDHPKEMWQTLWANPSYIFFQEMDGGPFGTERVQLTPGRSLAVDRNYIPLGMPVFIDTVFPGNADNPFVITRRLMVAQDTGRAIVGPTRGDVYFGEGAAAGQIAGTMKSGGDFTVLVPRAIQEKMPGGLLGILSNFNLNAVLPAANR